MTGDVRKQIAAEVAKALLGLPCCQPADGWKHGTVTTTETTSGCPVVRLDLHGAGAFNITITRARK